MNYKGGRRTQYTNQLIVDVNECPNKEQASKLISNTVEWTTPTGKKIIGNVRRAHGNNGRVLVRFNKGLPGQALGSEVEIKED